MGAQVQQTPGAIRTVLETLRDTTVVGAVYAFFAGFAYVYHLYAHFGIPVGVLEVPFNQFPIYAYTVITAHPWHSGACGLAFAAVFALVALVRMPTAIRNLILSALAIGLLLLLGRASARIAEQHAVEMRAGLIYQKRIVFVVDEQALPHYPPAFVAANSAQEPRLRLIAVTKESYFVLDQATGEVKAELPFGNVYEVPRRDVRLSRLLIPNATLNGGQ